MFEDDIMARLEKLPLDSEEVRTELENLLFAVRSCYGPKGRILAVQPVLSGHTSLTSSSQRLLSLWKAKSRATQLLTTSLQAFSTQYQEGGLFATLLSTNLILKGLDLQLPRRQVAAVIGFTMVQAAAHLKSHNCACRLELPMSSEWFMALVRSMLCTRPVSGLDKTSRDQLASLLLQAFLHIVPAPGETHKFCSKQQFHLHSVVDNSASGFSMVKGLLIELQDSSLWVDDCCPKELVLKRNGTGNITTALFDISMAGDPSDGYPDGLHLESDLPMDLASVMIERMLEIARSLVLQGVGFVGCQRCMHRRVKSYFKDQGVVVLDRLSSVYIGAVKDVTGGEIISSFSLSYPPDCMGALTRITPKVIKDRRFLILEGSSPQATLVLHCKSEVDADELVPLCRGVVSVLEMSLYYPHVLYGGGCTETILGHYLEMLRDSVTPETLAQLQCNRRTYDTVIYMMTASFDAVAQSLGHGGELFLTDLCTHHCWQFPSVDEMSVDEQNSVLAKKTCCCGAVVLSELPPGCQWRCLQPGEIVPDSLIETARRVRSAPMVDGSKVHNRCPSAIDLCFIKMKAVELAGELASSILRIAFMIRAT